MSRKTPGYPEIFGSVIGSRYPRDFPGPPTLLVKVILIKFVFKGSQAKVHMVKSKLPNSVLGKIWTLSDIDKVFF